MCSTWGANVETLNAAASNSTGSIDEAGNPQEPVASLGGRGPSFRLDDLVKDQTRVSLIKIDVEAHELPVLAGAAAYRHQHRADYVNNFLFEHLS